jgi:Ran GTPase-activating protein (RanGAP) involved in mRNA processing and transport
MKNNGKRRESVGYNINKLIGGVSEFMKSEDERKEKFEQAVQKKKDRSADELFNKKKKLNSRSSFATRSSTPQQESDAMEKAAETANAAIESAEKGQNELEGKEHMYFGESARASFAQRFKTASKDLERYKDEATIPAAKLTPRSLYLREGAKKNLLPLPIVLRKESNPMGVHLPHRGIGDVRMIPLIKVMDTLPAIQTIDLCDNRLTDVTLIPLAAKLLQFKSLTHLDLSFNKMDKSSATIMDFLKSPDCQLYTLLLNGADVDDQECRNLAEAISLNKSIKTLGLSKNLIGNDELLNVLNPSLITGGEALGAMLKSNTTLTELDLSWNGIRLESAIAIAEALDGNSTLKTLLLGYNSFGDMPSQVLGRALKTNTGLTLLDLEYNSINPKAATVLANAISFNETLLKLNINGNVLGKIGAQALVAAIQRSSRENRALQVSFINCDCVMDEGNIFSAGNPHGTWRLNLREPYGQMVAAECMYLANYKAGCRIVRLWLNGNLVTLERAYIVSSEEGEAGAIKKFKLEEFYKNSRIAANEMLAENYPEASKGLNNILSSFGFKMEEEMRLQVLQKTFELWTAKAKREGRDVSVLLSMSLSCHDAMFRENNASHSLLTLITLFVSRT